MIIEEFQKLCLDILNRISKIPQLSNKQALKCEKCITEKELFEVLKRMSNGKSPQNDGFTREFF